LNITILTLYLTLNKINDPVVKQTNEKISVISETTNNNHLRKKYSFLKRNDIVNSLTYKAKEMNYYSDALSKHSYLRLFRENTVVFDIYI